MTTSGECLEPTNSPASDTFSNAPTVTNSVRSQPKCRKCRQIFHTLSQDERDKWPPGEDLEKPCHGWPSVVNIMVKNPGFASFQAFRDLHIKSLLYYQAELVSMREEIHGIEWEDHDRGGFADSEKLSEDAEFLLQTESNFTSQDKGSKQIRKIKDMRKVLKEYSKQSFQF